MPTRPWREIRRPLSLKREAEIKVQIESELARMKLPELRRIRQLTQQSVGDLLGIAQGDVSKLERRADAYVGTLRSYIEALGGRLRILAEFPESEPIEIEGFSTANVAPRVSKPARRRTTVPVTRRRRSA
jgi:transcriptional regulator with XRE-family HTH domain